MSAIQILTDMKNNLDNSIKIRVSEIKEFERQIEEIKQIISIHRESLDDINKALDLLGGVRNGSKEKSS